MQYLSVIFFLLVLGVFGYLIFKRIKAIKRNIFLGKDIVINDYKTERFKKMLLVAFGQQKMFKKPIPAFLHLLIYVGFIIINIEVLEFIIDGLTNSHRVFAPFLGGIYPILMNIFEFLALGVVISCIIFLVRRNLLKIKRFDKIEMIGWPTLDANLILIIELLLMAAIFTMNATDQLLQEMSSPKYVDTGHLAISGLMKPVFAGFSESTLILIERGAWWFHIIGIFAFALYVTYSKHLHIFMAFPNTYYSKLDNPGKMENMESVSNEVKMMMGIGAASTNEAPPEIARFGAKDVVDLSWKNIMDAYACTECGRCTAECPANHTGKKLSPRKIMMDVRDRAEELGQFSDNGGTLEHGKSLLGDYITKEELNACTSCNACVEACPVTIDPLSIILEMRRFMAMEESSSPASWNNMFQNIETSFSPWKFAPTDRFKWSQEMKEESNGI